MGMEQNVRLCLFRRLGPVSTVTEESEFAVSGVNYMIARGSIGTELDRTGSEQLVSISGVASSYRHITVLLDQRECETITSCTKIAIVYKR